MIILDFRFSFFKTVKFQFKQCENKTIDCKLILFDCNRDLWKLMSMKTFLCRNCWLRTGDNKGTR